MSDRPFDESDAFLAGLELRRAVLGDAHVSRSLASAGEDPFMRDIQQLTTEFGWGTIWTRPGLPRKVRSFLSMAYLAANGKTEEFKTHVRGALNNGASPEEIKEVIIQAALYCGFPVALECFRHAHGVLEAHAAELAASETPAGTTMEGDMRLLCEGYGLIEGPTWDPARGLVFSDVANGGVHAVDVDGKVSTVVPHRRGIGGIALHENGGLVVGGRNIALKPADGGPTQVIFAGVEGRDLHGFNDLTTDPQGRIYVGSLGHDPLDHGVEPGRGNLYCIDLDGSAREVATDVRLTNGLGFSPDGTRLYHSDSRDHIVRVYTVAPNGDLGPYEVFARIDDGIPDGLAVATDGSVWVAIADGQRVEGYEPDGTLRATLPCPQPMVTSVCFGGEGLADLYVVTGSRGTGRENAGSVFRTEVGVAGQPLAAARVAVG